MKMRDLAATQHQGDKKMIRRRFRIASTDTIISEDEMLDVTVKQDVLNDLRAGLTAWVDDAMKWKVTPPEIIGALTKKVDELKRD
jgi:hypothetical protein